MVFGAAEGTVSQRIPTQVGDQCIHLLIGESPRKARHHALACEHHAPHLGVSCRSAAGQRSPFEDAMQVGWNLFESQIIVLMAVRTADGIQMLAVRLLRRSAGAEWHPAMNTKPTTIPKPAGAQTQSSERISR